MKWQDVNWERYAIEGQQTKDLEADVATWFEYHKVIIRDPTRRLQISGTKPRFLRDIAEGQKKNARRFSAKIGNQVNQNELDEPRSFFRLN